MMANRAEYGRDMGAEAVIRSEQLVVGDFVILDRGRVTRVRRTGEPSRQRCRSASSSLTGERASRRQSEAAALSGRQTSARASSRRWRFTHTPVAHGKRAGVDRHGDRERYRRSARSRIMLSASTERKPRQPARCANTLTLWIVGAAGFTTIVMFAPRPQPRGAGGRP